MMKLYALAFVALLVAVPSAVHAARVLAQGCTTDWQRCTDNPTCCGGMKCYQQDSYWAQCRPEGDFPQGWTLMGGSSPAQTSSAIVEATSEVQPQTSGSGSGCVPAWGGCMDNSCCSGATCYRAGDHWSQCMPPNAYIPPGWEPTTGSASLPSTPPSTSPTPIPAPQQTPPPTPPPTTRTEPEPRSQDPPPATPPVTDNEAPEITTPSTDPPTEAEPTTEPPTQAPAPAPEEEEPGASIFEEEPEPEAVFESSSASVGDACDGQGKWDLASWDTQDALGKAWLFFKAQQSGKLEAGHPIAWRGDSYLKDGDDVGVDLTGGFFDAGDHLKLIFPYTFTLTNIAWAATEGKSMIAAGGHTARVNDVLDRFADFLMRCHLGPGSFVTSVGNFDDDHSACYRAQLDTFTPRRTWFIDNSTPGSDLLYMASAALSAYSEARTGDLATRAAAKAQVLFAEGKAQEGTMYSSSIPEMGRSYPSESAEQYGFLAAAWLFRTTKDAKWRTEAERLQGISKFPIYYTYSWSHVYAAACVIMNHEVDGEERYWTPLDAFTQAHMDGQHGVVITPGGYSWVNSWGSMGHASGAAAIIAAYGRDVADKDAPRGAAMKEHAQRQIAYIFGAGTGRSYLTGFGCNPPQNPHHRDAALTLDQSAPNCDAFNRDDFTNANKLVGGLVGGPNQFDAYNDVRSNHQQNEVAMDYNAQFIIGLVQSSV